MNRKMTMAKNKEAAELLRTRRESQGLTQEQVAERAGIRTTMYGRFERGERNIYGSSFYTASAVLRVLGIDIGEIPKIYTEG